MNPSDLITQKIIDYCKPLQLIVIVGYTKSGKVTIAKKLAKSLNRDLLIADDYIDLYGHDNALNEFKYEVERRFYAGEQFIVEGVLCFRLLRNLINSGGILPDLIMKTECNEDTIYHFYNKEEPNKNLNRVFGFNQGLEKIWKDYIDLVHLNNQKVKVLTLNTSIF